jgi:hypothetical protein
MLGNLTIGAALDTSQAEGLTGVWLLLLGLGFASALTIMALDSRGQIDQTSLLSARKARVPALAPVRQAQPGVPGRLADRGCQTPR